MGDIAIDNYKKSVAKLVENWGREADKVAKQLAPLETELAKLEAIKDPGPDDKKQIEELKKKKQALQKCMEDASESLRVSLIIIQLPANADEKELIKLPGWLKEIIKAKGIPLGKSGVSIAPDVSFDFKARKLKYLGITIKW